MTATFIINAKRSAVAPRMGALAQLELHELAAPVIQSLLSELDIAPEQVDEVIVSNALGAGGNPARVIALAAGLPERIAGLTIDRQCVGGLDAIGIAKAMVSSGAANIVIAGGVESYSRRPVRLRSVIGASVLEPYDRPPFTPWNDRDPDLSSSAAQLAQDYGISRQAQDQFAINSHQKALNCISDLRSEVVEIESLTNDAYTRTLSESLCKRAPIIDSTITFANSAVAADGAAFCLVVSADIAKQFPDRCVEVASTLTVGDRPDQPALAPVAAINSIFAQTGLGPTDIDQSEIMEAYAVQAMLCCDLTGLDMAKVNVKGGALARGHPIGASGAILVVRLFNDMINANKANTCLAAIAAAGGLGSAMILRR